MDKLKLKFEEAVKLLNENISTIEHENTKLKALDAQENRRIILANERKIYNAKRKISEYQNYINQLDRDMKEEMSNV